MRCCVTYSPGAPLPTSRQQQRLLCCAGSVHPATLNGSANRSPTAWAGRSARGTPYSANAKQISELLAASGSTLTGIVGIGAITAGRLIGRTGRAARFPTAAAFANYAGVAPVEVASADKARHRLSRSGDRQLNAALHTVAITQIRTPGSRGHTYYNAKLAEGKTPREARLYDGTAGCLTNTEAPKGTDLSTHSTQHLLAVENELNNRPRLVLNDRPPADLFGALLASKNRPRCD